MVYGVWCFKSVTQGYVCVCVMVNLAGGGHLTVDESWVGMGKGFLLRGGGEYHYNVRDEK